MNKSNKLLLTVALCGMMASSVGICMNSLGVFYTPVSTELNVGRGTFALYTTFSSFSSALFQMIIPNLYNNSNFKKIYLGGVILGGLSLLGMSFAKQVTTFYILAVMLGIGNSCFNTVTISTIINNSVKENVGSLMGFVMSFSGLAGAILSPSITAVISHFGWRKAYIVMAFALVVLNLPGLLGKISYGSDKKETKEKQDSVLRSNLLPFVYIMVLAIFVNVIVGMSQHLSGFAETRGLDAAKGSLLVSAMMVGNISFKIISGWLSDRLGTVKTATIVVTITMTGALLLLSQKAPLLLALGAFCLGAPYSIPSVLIVFYIKEIYGLENYTRLYSINNFIGASCFALALSMIGYIYDFTGSYNLFLTAVVGMDAIMYVMIYLLQKSSKNN